MGADGTPPGDWLPAWLSGPPGEAAPCRRAWQGPQTGEGWVTSGSPIDFSELGCKGEGLGSRYCLAGKFHICPWAEGWRAPVRG